MSFEVKSGGQLVAKNSRGEVLYKGRQGEFKEHDGLKVNASPEKRRLGELFLDKESLRGKHQMEGRANSRLTPVDEKKFDRHAENQAIKQKGVNASVSAYHLSRTATAPVRVISRGTSRIITWARQPSAEQSKEQNLERNRRR